ncbi:hypothetical protein IW15_22225 [Chryseobacterium soli]|uniref:Uncharacterized protein n=1 Tax=Chryseobacterium soli TaxID=445961 RepID=A0A085ZZB3_9FLAO|nr:hypothetical protein [Chryseobacterium soli]KFF09777.1 hypothetical protein IW15_22225 [Chryseobacterium soli]
MNIAVIKTPGKLKGKAKGEMLSIFGDNYYSEYGRDICIYNIKNCNIIYYKKNETKPRYLS